MMEKNTAPELVFIIWKKIELEVKQQQVAGQIDVVLHTHKYITGYMQ